MAETVPLAMATKSNLVSCFNYRDASAAIEWLCRAFGFQAHSVFRDEEGRVVHAELSFGNGMIMIGPESKSEFGQKFMTTPVSAGGRCTQTIYVVVADADAHHARAVAAGADIVMPLKDEDYGGRGYSARDPDGHVWSFGTYDPWARLPPGQG